MTTRFLQIHTLHSYPAALLNRDDVGMAKRLPFGGSVRTRVSSQCLKRHWRMAQDENSLSGIQVDDGTVPMSIRSRQTFEREIRRPLLAAGVTEDRAAAATQAVLDKVLPKSKKKAQGKKVEGASDTAIETEQVTVIGRPEVEYLRSLALEIGQADDEIKDAAKSVLDTKEMRANLTAMKAGAGLDAAMFGRMTTGDILSRCDAAVHVAHAFTVHEGTFEADYFSAVDDLLEVSEGETGSGHINSSELTSGLFYGYVVVDIPLLVSNVLGCKRSDWQGVDRSLPAEAVRRLLHLIATVSPGAKLGSTAPYSYADLVLVEAGSEQPRTLANAFLRAVEPQGGLLENTLQALGDELESLDACYPGSSERRHCCTRQTEAIATTGGERVPFPELAQWAAEVVGGQG